MSESDWWKPAKLKAREQAFLNINSASKLDTENDFGSYRVMRMTGDVRKSQIMSHNDLTPQYRVRALKKILGSHSQCNILDIGCGLGYTTNALADEFDAITVTGVDISEDAISYATNEFENCTFRCESIDPNRPDQRFAFDLITAFEFYPFTRTNSLEDHIAYILHLTKDMEAGGMLVLFQLWDNPESLSTNYETLKEKLTTLDFMSFDMPIRTIGKYVFSRRVANVISNFIRPILRVITGRRVGANKFVIITKRPV